MQNEKLSDSNHKFDLEIRYRCFSGCSEHAGLNYLILHGGGEGGGL